MALDMWATHKTDIGVVPVSDPVSPSPSLTLSLSLSLSVPLHCPYIPESVTASGALSKNAWCLQDASCNLNSIALQR